MKEFILKNCFNNKIKLEINMDEVKYIFRQVISSDEILIVVYKNGKVSTFDSDCHGRCMSFSEELEMIYPEEIKLDSGNCYEPGEVDYFYLLKEGETKWKQNIE